MKEILILTTLLITSSCFNLIKNKKNEDSNHEIVHVSTIQNLNSDHDVIPDSLDNEKDISNIPSLRVSELLLTEIKTGNALSSEFNKNILSFKKNRGNESSNSYASKKIEHLQYKLLTGQELDEKDMISENDINTFSLSNWSSLQQNIVSFLNKSTDFENDKLATIVSNLTISKKDELFSVLDIKTSIASLKNFTSLKTYTPFTLVSRDGRELEIGESEKDRPGILKKMAISKDILTNVFKEGDNLGVVINDFSFKYNNKEYLYSAELEKIRQNTAEIIIKLPNGDVDRKFVVTNKSLTLGDALNRFFGDCIFSDGRIDIFLNESNDFSGVIDWNNLRQSDLNIGGWSWWASNNQRLNDPIMSNTVYVISYSKLSELIKHRQQIEVKIVQEEKIGEIFKTERPIEGSSVGGILKIKAHTPSLSGKRDADFGCTVGVWRCLRWEYDERDRHRDRLISPQREICKEWGHKNEHQSCRFNFYDLKWNWNHVSTDINEIYKLLKLTINNTIIDEYELKNIVKIQPIDNEFFYFELTLNDELASQAEDINLSIINPRHDSISWGGRSSEGPTHTYRYSEDRPLFRGWDGGFPTYQTPQELDYLVDGNIFKKIIK